MRDDLHMSQTSIYPSIDMHSHSPPLSTTTQGYLLHLHLQCLRRKHAYDAKPIAPLPSPPSLPPKPAMQKNHADPDEGVLFRRRDADAESCV
jgi:hypothetical protein